MPKKITLALLLCVSCAPESADRPAPAAAPEQAPATPAAEPAAPALPAEVEALEIRNARLPAPHLLTGGQLSREQMEALRDLGYRSFVSLRPAGESGAGWEEEFAGTAGVTFVRIPVAGAAGVTRENAERLADTLREFGGAPAVVYCASGNRVGALLALKEHLVDGESAEDALEFGVEAGLTRLEPKVRELLGLAEEAG